ncbi:MAG: hypothetical protein GC159_05145 [Phycisphaera sp.]|nr:hypothetical protein [Phycisphaera sp.]
MGIEDPNQLSEIDRAIAENERALNPLPWHEVEEAEEADDDDEVDVENMTDEEYEAYIERLGREKKPGDPDYLDPAQYGEELAAWHNAPMTSAFEQLTRAGIDLPAPEDLDDAQLHDKLWEVIHALAKRSTYLACTDHLSDRELYSELWNEVLHEWCKDLESMLPQDQFAGPNAWTQHIDMLGSGSEEDTQLYLRYYATGEDRALWLKDWPEEWGPPPEYEEPPYDRDRLLPQAPEPQAFRDEDTNDNNLPPNDGHDDIPF